MGPIDEPRSTGPPGEPASATAVAAPVMLDGEPVTFMSPLEALDAMLATMRRHASPRAALVVQALRNGHDVQTVADAAGISVESVTWLRELDDMARARDTSRRHSSGTVVS